MYAKQVKTKVFKLLHPANLNSIGSFTTILLSTILGSRLKTVHGFGMIILDIDKLTSTDSGQYVCTASNAFGEATSTMTLKCVERGMVEQKPKFTSQLVVSVCLEICIIYHGIGTQG